MLRIILMLPLCCWLAFASALNLDSLRGVWNDTSQADTSRLKAIQKIASDGYLFSQPDSSFYFAQQQYEFAKSFNNKIYMGRALNLQATSFAIRGNFAKALLYFRESLKIFEELENKKGIVATLNNIGIVYNDLGDYKMAIKYYKRSLKINEVLGDKRGIANLLGNIGHIHGEQGNYVKALHYLEESVNIKKEIGDKKGIASSLGNIGIIYYHQGNYNEANVFFIKSLNISKEYEDKHAIAISLSLIGNVYLKQSNYKKGLSYFKKSLDLYKEVKDQGGIAGAYNYIGIAYKEQGEFQKSLTYLTDALKISQEIGALDQVDDNSKALYEVYKRTGNYSKALEMHELYLTAIDSIAKMNAEEELYTFEVEKEYELKKQADSIQNADTVKLKNIQLQTQKTRTNYLIIGVFIMLLFLILAVYNYRAKMTANKTLQDQKKTIEEKNKELERLSIVASKTENIILIMDPEGNVEWVNNSFVKLNNLTMKELIAERGPNIKTISNNPDMARIIEECKKSKTPYRYDSLNITNQGESVWESSTLTPIYDEQGILNKFIIIDTDITKQKNAEELLNQKNKDITDSINYAQRIQSALLPSKEALSLIPNGFVLFQPKDIVSGDFYWMQQHKNRTYLAACDCTGHGVPGAFMSMISSSLLDEAVLEKNITQPSEIFFEVRKGIIKALKQTEEAGSQKDGMDAVLCSWDQNGKLEYALAYNPFFLIRNGELIETKADKQPVGFHTGAQNPFTHHEANLEKGDTIYIFSDGYPDQFGGPKDKKFMMKNFKKLLLSIQEKPMNEQKTILKETLDEWKGDTEQVDDILVMGVRF